MAIHVPSAKAIPNHNRPTSLVVFIAFGLLFSAIAIITDSIFYRPNSSFLETLRNPIITPLNNLLYNTNTSNLAQHGLHPRHQHLTANLLQLLGPAYIVMLLSLFSRPLVPTWMRNTRALSALSATTLLSLFPHQEPRFLLPCVPLLLSCIRIKRPIFLATWIIFNAAMGLLMGIYHQGGVVPTQLAIPELVSTPATVFWWKTYSPPLWLLGNNSHVTTHDLMGSPGPEMIGHLDLSVPACGTPSSTFLVAPASADFLDQYMDRGTPIQLQPLWSYGNHLNLDDLDFAEDGILPTLKRVIGRRGLDVWAVERPCK